MSYEWTSCQCPACGELAEYNCVDKRVFCQVCHARKRERQEKSPELRIAEALERIADAQDAGGRR